MNNAKKSVSTKKKKVGTKEVTRNLRQATKQLKVRPEVHALIVREQNRINASVSLDPAWNLEDIVHQAIMTWLQEDKRLDYVFREKNDRFFEAECAQLQ